MPFLLPEDLRARKATGSSGWKVKGNSRAIFGAPALVSRFQ
jgi:hypothetical protein